MPGNVIIPDGKLDGPLAPRSRILYTLLLILLLVGVVPLAGYAWHQIGAAAETQKGYILELQNEMLGNVAEVTSAYLRSYRVKLEDMAQGYAMVLSFMQGDGNPFDTLENENNLKGIISSDPNIIKLGSIASEGEGRVVATQDFQWPVVDGYLVEAAERARKGEFYTSSPFYARELRDSVLVMAAPVLVRETPDKPEVRGIVFAILNLNQLQLKLSDRKRALELFVLEGQDRLVAHTDPTRLGKEDGLGQHTLVREYRKGNAAIGITQTYDLVESGRVTTYVGTAKPVHGSPNWAVFGQTDNDDAMSAVTDASWQSALAVLAVLAMVVFVGFVFGVSISNPIRLLSDGALRLARGDYAEKIAFESNNELGQLAATFNYMSDEIQERERRLTDAAVENKELFLGTIRTLAAAIDAKDPYTRGHSERVTFYTVAIAEEMGMNDDDVEKMRISALLHDVGKIGIDDTILRKPGALTDEEYEVMKGHPQKGAEIMAPIKQMKPFIAGIRFHHETLAGTGYPLGLKGDQVPVEARIIQVADTFDAMTTDRPYQKGMEVEAALDRIQSFVGKRYDQSVVDALKRAVTNGKVLPGLRRRDGG